MGTIRTIDLREYFASGQFDKDCEEYQAERAKNTRNGKVLVGVDKNGREVYEGDKVKNPVDGTTFQAAMNHINTIKSYELCRDKK